MVSLHEVQDEAIGRKKGGTHASLQTPSEAGGYFLDPFFQPLLKIYLHIQGHDTDLEAPHWTCGLGLLPAF